MYGGLADVSVAQRAVRANAAGKRGDAGVCKRVQAYVRGPPAYPQGHECPRRGEGVYGGPAWASGGPVADARRRTALACKMVRRAGSPRVRRSTPRAKAEKSGQRRGRLLA